MDETASVYQQIKAQTDIFEKARSIDYLKKEKQIPLKEISQFTNIKPSYLCHILRLRKLPDLVVDGYYSKLISISHLFIISRLKNQEQMVAAYEKVLTENLSVVQTENLIREALYHVKNEGNFLPADEKNQFIKSFEAQDKIKVRVVQTRTRAKLILELKGSLLETSQILKNIMRKLGSWKKDPEQEAV